MKNLRFSARTRVLFFSITYLYLLIHRIMEILKPASELKDFKLIQRRVNSPDLRLTLEKHIDIDFVSNNGGADKKSDHDFQDILLKKDSHSIPFKYEESLRTSYITKHNSVAR